jgi:phage gp46-like protein
MRDPYQGDIKIYIDEDGADFKFIDGQPVMDSGLVNSTLISLFTDIENERGHEWFGNTLLPAENRIGSDFEAVGQQNITADNLADLENATRRALQWQLDNNYISDLEVVVTNPVGYSRDVKIVQYQPDGSSTTIKFWMDQNGAVNVNI